MQPAGSLAPEAMVADHTVPRRARSVSTATCYDQPSPTTARVVVHCPDRIPVPEPWPPNLFHPFLRPLQRAFERGNPAIGTLHFVLLGGGAQYPMLALVTLVEGPGKPWQWEPNRYLERRLIVFPGWGDGLVRVQTKAGRPGSKTDHITFEEPLPGRVSGHLTPVSDEPEEKPYPASPVFLPQGNVLHLCSFRVRQPRDVDAAGLVWCRVTSPISLPRIAIDDALEAAVEHDHHALVHLPPRVHWDDKHHLAINVLLSMGPLEDKDYPVDPGTIAPSLRRQLTGAEPEGNVLTRFVGLPIAGGRRIILGLSVRSGAPPNSWTLAMSNRGR